MTQPSITIGLGAERNTRMISITYHINKKGNKILRAYRDESMLAVYIEKRILSEVLEEFLSGKDNTSILFGETV